MLLIALCAGAALMFGYTKRGDFMPFSRVGGEVRSGLGGEIVQVKQLLPIVAAWPGVVVGKSTQGVRNA